MIGITEVLVLEDADQGLSLQDETASPLIGERVELYGRCWSELFGSKSFVSY